MHMPREPRRVPVPNENDITNAFGAHPKRAFVAVAGTTKEQLIYLNIAFRNGDIETLYLDANGAGRLISALKALAPTKAGIAASQVILGDGGETEVQEGVLFTEEEDE